MPDATAKGFPYPLDDEPISDGNESIQLLAEALDAALDSYLLAANLTKAAIDGLGVDAETLDGLDSLAFLRHSLALAAGDILVASGAGAFVRKALGSPGEALRVNAAGNGLEYAALGAVSLIADTKLLVDTATVTFSAIPQTYKHLLLVVGRARCTGTGFQRNLNMRVNGSSAVVYDFSGAKLAATYAGIGSTNQAQATITGDMPATDESGGRWGSGTIEFNDYTDSSRGPQWVSAMGNSANGGGVTVTSGIHRTVAALTEIQLYPVSGDFLAGSRFSLYGIN